MTHKFIDAHVHIWDQSRNEEFIATKVFPVLKGKNFLERDMHNMLAATSASQAVLVHGPATDSHTDFCLQLARQNEQFLSVIGWIDLRAQGVVERLNELSANPYFKGVRLTPMLDSDPWDYLSGVKTIEILKLLSDKGLIVEVLAPVSLLPAVAAFCQKLPNLTVVIAHFGLPDLDSDAMQSWFAAMSAVAKCPKTRVKVSGLVLRGGCESDRAIASVYVSRLLKLFGAERMHYASNWPVMTAHSSPEIWLRDLQLILEAIGVSSSQTAAIFTGNSRALYTPSRERWA